MKSSTKIKTFSIKLHITNAVFLLSKNNFNKNEFYDLVQPKIISFMQKQGLLFNTLLSNCPSQLTNLLILVPPQIYKRITNHTRCISYKDYETNHYKLRLWKDNVIIKYELHILFDIPIIKISSITFKKYPYGGKYLDNTLKDCTTYSNDKISTSRFTKFKSEYLKQTIGAL